jgi:hypothetical protein
MKIFAPPCRNLAIVFPAVSCLFVAPIKAQTIQIDSTFNADGEIFPFSPNDTIFGLSISGSVHLFSDTSLVRIILTDQAGQEWMVYEAYPMIVSDTAFELKEQCDETCYIDECMPYSLTIQLIDAVIEISYLSVDLNPGENMSALQYQEKKTRIWKKYK